MDSSNFDLTGLADLGEEEVPGVAVALVVIEDARDRVVVAEVLPAGEPAGHRDHVRVAELLERAGGEDAPHAGGAVDDDLGVLVGEHVLDPALEMRPGEVMGGRDLAEGDLFLLPDVEELQGSALVEALFHVLGGDLADLLAELAVQVSKVCHVPTLQ